jgi:hypothetical protein
MPFHGKPGRHPLLSLSDTDDNSKHPQTSSPSPTMFVCHHNNLPAIDNHRIDRQ